MSLFQVEVFWVVTPCSVVVGYQRFRVPCFIHLQVEAFWVVTSCSVVIGYESFKAPCWLLQGPLKFCILQQYYMTSQLRRSRLECSTPSKPQILQQGPSYNMTDDWRNQETLHHGDARKKNKTSSTVPEIMKQNSDYMSEAVTIW